MRNRKLALRREVLSEIDSVGLARLAGGTIWQENTPNSCLDYISCNRLACLVRDLTRMLTEETCA